MIMLIGSCATAHWRVVRCPTSAGSFEVSGRLCALLSLRWTELEGKEGGEERQVVSLVPASSLIVFGPSDVASLCIIMGPGLELARNEKGNPASTCGTEAARWALSLLRVPISRIGSFILRNPNSRAPIGGVLPN